MKLFELKLALAAAEREIVRYGDTPGECRVTTRFADSGGEGEWKPGVETRDGRFVAFMAVDVPSGVR